MAPVKKLRDFFFFILLRRKTSLGFLKIRFNFPKNGLGRRHAEQAKIGKKYEKGGFVFGKAVFRTPPEVVSGFRGGGGGGPLE
jgi:hypothetical protein